MPTPDMESHAHSPRASGGVARARPPPSLAVRQSDNAVSPTSRPVRRVDGGAARLDRVDDPLRRLRQRAVFQENHPHVALGQHLRVAALPRTRAIVGGREKDLLAHVVEEAVLWRVGGERVSASAPAIAIGIVGVLRLRLRVGL